VNPAAVISFGALPGSDVDDLARHDIPLVHNLLEPGGTPLRGLSQHAIGGLQVRHLASLGHRVIGFAALDDPREEPFGRPRLEGARQECRDLSLPDPVVAVLAYERASARAALAVWRAAGVTAVAAFNDLVALAVLGACRIERTAVPGDLALIGVDDLPVGAISVPALSTIAMDQSVPARDLAARAIALVGGTAPGDPGGDPDIYRVVRRETT
jgi:DNA-binding LacI/PurR family transcriptional regulator